MVVVVEDRSAGFEFSVRRPNEIGFQFSNSNTCDLVD